MQRQTDQCILLVCAVFLGAVALYGVVTLVNAAEAAPPSCTGYVYKRGYIGVLPEFDC